MGASDALDFSTFQNGVNNTHVLFFFSSFSPFFYKVGVSSIPFEVL
jgi:hypothetical protein